MRTIEILETYEIASLNKTAAIIQFQEDIIPEVGDIFQTSDKEKIQITGIEMFPLGSSQQLKKRGNERINGRYGCTIEFID
jgi:hypothetical protein